MLIRLAEPPDLGALGELTVAAYADFTRGAEDSYVDKLRDSATRAEEAELWVAVGESDEDRGALLGSVTSCPPGSSWREVAHEDEGEFRMLAVAPAAQGLGVGRALVEHVEAGWRSQGARAMALSSLPQMAAAHRLYDRLGYRRDPARDWDPLPGVHLIAFGKDLR